MSDVDVVMMMELEKKITNRIREQIDLCVHGFVTGHSLQFDTDGYISTKQIHDRLISDVTYEVASRLARDDIFISRMKHKVGEDNV